MSRAAVARSLASLLDQCSRFGSCARAGLGANYPVSKAGSLDFGYRHAFVKDAPVSISTPTAGALVGTYKGRADVLSVQYNQAF